MGRRLDVWLHEDLAGKFEQQDNGRQRFTYLGAWLAGRDRQPVSLSLPLREEPFDDAATRAFFGGLLPDDDVRKRLARHLGVSVHNEFALLEVVGRECAGALTIVPEGEDPRPARRPAFEPLDDKRLAALLRELPKRPLLVGAELRLSLAGAQDKIAVYLDGSTIALPKGGLATTHLLKVPIAGCDETVQNELLCSRVATRMRLQVPPAEMRVVDGIPILLVERYDRIRDDRGKPRRLHQEDFCQALGIPPHLKYQSEGGPGTAQMFGLLEAHAERPALDRLALLRGVVFNFLIGNADAHGKNFSLMHRPSGVALAPFYDLLCTLAYPGLSRRLAMKLGGKRDFPRVGRAQWEAFARECALAPPLVLREVAEMAEALPAAVRAAAEEAGLDATTIATRVRARADARSKSTLQALG